MHRLLKGLLTFILSVQFTLAHATGPSQEIKTGIHETITTLLHQKLPEYSQKVQNPAELKKIFALTKDPSVQKKLGHRIAELSAADLKRVKISAVEDGVLFEMDGETIELNTVAGTLSFRTLSIDITQKNVDQIALELLPLMDTTTNFKMMDLLIPRAHAILPGLVMLVLTVVGFLYLAAMAGEQVMNVIKILDCRTILNAFRAKIQERYDACWVGGENPFPFRKDSALIELLNRYNIGDIDFNVNQCKGEIAGEFRSKLTFFGQELNVACMAFESRQLCHDMRMLHRCHKSQQRRVNTSERAPGERESSPAPSTGAPAAGAQAR